jgi:hypothetical protein
MSSRKNRSQPLEIVEFRPGVMKRIRHSDNKVLSVGAFSVASWVAESIAGGVLAGMGSDFWEELSGELSVADALERATAAFERIIGVALARERLIRANVLLESATEDMKLNPPAIDSAWERCTEAKNTFKTEDIRVDALPNFMTAAGLQLAILQQRAAALRTEDALNDLRSAFETLSNDVDIANEAALAAVNRMFIPGGPKTVFTIQNRQRAVLVSMSAYYVCRGLPYSTPTFPRIWGDDETSLRERVLSEAGRLKALHHEREIATIQESVVDVNEAIVEDWREFATGWHWNNA